MRFIRTVTPVAALLLALTACSSTDATGEAPALPEVPATTQDQQADDVITSNPNTNERGLIVKQLGEQAGIGKEGETPRATFTIDKIEVDPQCHQYGQKPQAGHTLVLHARVATGSDPQSGQVLAGVLNPYNFAVLTASGVTKKAEYGMCTDPSSRMQPGTYGVNQKYSGTIEIAVPESNGVLIQPLPSAPNGGGWEWHY